MDGVAGGPCSPDVECVNGVLSRFEAVPVPIERPQRSVDALDPQHMLGSLIAMAGGAFGVLGGLLGVRMRVR